MGKCHREPNAVVVSDVLMKAFAFIVTEELFCLCILTKVSFCEIVSVEALSLKMPNRLCSLGLTCDSVLFSKRMSYSKMLLNL